MIFLIMGVVDKAGVHGVVPDDRVFAVNYPGYPSSLARATQTLGGEKRIAEVCDSITFYYWFLLSVYHAKEEFRSNLALSLNCGLLFINPHFGQEDKCNAVSLCFPEFCNVLLKHVFLSPCSIWFLLILSCKRRN